MKTAINRALAWLNTASDNVAVDAARRELVAALATSNPPAEQLADGIARDLRGQQELSGLSLDAVRALLDREDSLRDMLPAEPVTLGDLMSAAQQRDGKMALKARNLHPSIHKLREAEAAYWANRGVKPDAAGAWPNPHAFPIRLMDELAQATADLLAARKTIELMPPGGMPLTPMTEAQRLALFEVLRMHILNVEEAPRSSDEWPEGILESEGHLFLVALRDAVALKARVGEPSPPAEQLVHELRNALVPLDFKLKRGTATLEDVAAVVARLLEFTDEVARELRRAPEL